MAAPRALALWSPPAPARDKASHADRTAAAGRPRRGPHMAKPNQTETEASAPRAAAGRCLLYTSDAADDTPCVDLGGRRIIKKKK